MEYKYTLADSLPLHHVTNHKKMSGHIHVSCRMT
uniref:Uncharacterized protein n=1 Tax=Arundo donax TaxID=35708 RepID=A0A0A9CK04_ARUDO